MALSEAAYRERPSNSDYPTFIGEMYLALNHVQTRNI
jgi:hypothetical protein